LDGSQVLYDLQASPPDLLPGSMPWLLLVISIAAALALMRSRRAREGDPLLSKAGYVLILLVAAAAFGVSYLPQLLGWGSRSAKVAETEIFEGCVRNFRRVIGSNGRMTDTYFAVGKASFHFNSSPWVPGLHNAHDLIRAGEGLRVTRAGGTVLRIERAAHACSLEVR
jgi:hypothetical protein